MAKIKKQKADPDKGRLRGQDTPREGKDRENREKEPDGAGPHDYGGLPARDLKKNLGCG